MIQCFYKNIAQHQHHNRRHFQKAVDEIAAATQCCCVVGFFGVCQSQKFIFTSYECTITHSCVVLDMRKKILQIVHTKNWQKNDQHSLSFGITQAHMPPVRR